MNAPARRVPLAELDALSGLLEQRVKDFTRQVREVERRHTTTCPTCDAPVLGLLAGCRKPACTRAAIAADVALDQRCEDRA